jgi:ATP adenylyltransferase
MHQMFAPWRLAYAKGQALDADVLPCPTGCIFCDYPATTTLDDDARNHHDRRALIVATRKHAFVMLNKYPYGNGHIMVVPRRHVADLQGLNHAEATALHDLLREAAAAIQSVYRPDGMNIGMNVGAAGGAGIAAHLHWHVLPRWQGDVNFLPVFSDTKVILEALDDTWQRLRAVMPTHT